MKTTKIASGKSQTILVKITGDSDFTYRVGKNSHLTLVLIMPGGKDTKVSATVDLNGRGASASILGFAIGKGEAKLKLNTVQFHNAPKTTSNLLVKDILSGTSTIHYEGRIFVSKKAHLTDAYQKNENLMLTGRTRAFSKPTLEILANDVRCTHGSTTGTIPKESLWYLNSRGIGETKAKELIVEGFFESAISLISDKMVQDKVREELWQIMSK